MGEPYHRPDPPAGVLGHPAARVALAYDNAAKDKCKPRPIAAAERIELESGRIVVAVNVDPFPFALVGAMFYARDKNGNPQTCDAWRFPAIASAIEQPPEVDVGEIVVRPTAQA